MDIKNTFVVNIRRLVRKSKTTGRTGLYKEYQEVLGIYGIRRYGSDKEISQEDYSISFLGITCHIVVCTLNCFTTYVFYED